MKGGEQGSGGFPKHSMKFLEHSASFSTMSSQYFKVFPSFLDGFRVWMTFRVWFRIYFLAIYSWNKVGAFVGSDERKLCQKFSWKSLVEPKDFWVARLNCTVVVLAWIITVDCLRPQWWTIYGHCFYTTVVAMADLPFANIFYDYISTSSSRSLMQIT